jgi:hypothetical protein
VGGGVGSANVNWRKLQKERRKKKEENVKEKAGKIKIKGPEGEQVKYI